ncbi:MAG: hypothetical protein J6X22_01920 [Muribaculaceae bacterium]|nr:hypothetical protein [Muribaculaceae bacterium]
MISNVDIINLGQIVEYMKTVPFDVSRKRLYNAAELYDGYIPNQPESFENCYDTQVFLHYNSTGKQTNDIKESMARTLHDHSIYVALGEFFRTHNYLHCVGIMGGHALLRTDDMFKQIVYLCKRLTELGFFMLSGGGPGAMEATHLGAWMAGYSNDQVEDALHIMSVAPSFRDSGWLETAFEVIGRYPQTKYDSLGIPTWLYGHEPATPFATHIAKFFDNSIRENNILTLPFGGVVYTPGSAGTIQEIFQDAVQNHYLSFGFPSPMIFLDSKFWTNEVPLYPLLQKMMKKGKYKNLSLTLTDDFEEVIQKLLDFQELTKTHPEDFCLK